MQVPLWQFVSLKFEIINLELVELKRYIAKFLNKPIREFLNVIYNNLHQLT